MLSQVRMNLYYLFRSKSFYICFIVIGMFIGIQVLGNSFMVQDKTVDASSLSLACTINDYFRAGLFTLVLAIAVSINGCALYSSGYIKNVASSIHNKGYISISLFITWMIGTLIYILLSVLCMFLGNIVFIGVSSIGDINQIITYLGIVYFMNLVIVGLVTMFVSSLRNNAACITASVVILNFIQLIYMLIKQAIPSLDLMKYSIVGNIGNVSMEQPLNSTLLVSGIVCLLIYLGVAITSSKRLDIK